VAINSLLKHRQHQQKQLGDLAPRFSAAIESGPRGNDLFYQSFPFRRSVPAIIISGGMLAVFSVPLFSIGGSLTTGTDELFSFVSMAFSLFWMLGWSVGVALLLLVFLTLLLGRETLHVTADTLTLRIGIPGLGLGLAYPRELIRHFRRADHDSEAGTRKGIEEETKTGTNTGSNPGRNTGGNTGREWRGEHLLFDFAGQQVAFGSSVAGQRGAALLSQLQALIPEQGSPLPKSLELAAREPASEPASAPDAAPASRQIQSEATRISWRSPSALALIAANLVPLAGVFIADWNVGDLMLLFRAESAVIGVYNLLKMAKVAGWPILFLGPFFVGHYGGFMVGHLLFIYTLFVNGMSDSVDIPLSGVVQDFVVLAPALLAFVISHGVSYVQNFLGRREYLGRDANTQMGQPYKRIIIMHVTIIFGGFLVMALGSVLPALLLLVALKLGADLYAHLHEHRYSGSAAAGSGTTETEKAKG